jgi:putative acetyltransferase
VAVRDDWHGRGVGTALMTAIVDLADNWIGYSRLELTAYTDNEAALALYRKFGFEIEGTARRYAWRGGVLVDAYMMARHAGRG